MCLEVLVQVVASHEAFFAFIAHIMPLSSVGFQILCNLSERVKRLLQNFQ